MLSTRETPNTTVGTGRLKPALRSSAVAQTISRTPDTTSTIQAMTNPPLTVVVLSGRVRHTLVRVVREAATVPGSQLSGPAATACYRGHRFPLNPQLIDNRLRLP